MGITRTPDFALLSRASEAVRVFRLAQAAQGKDFIKHASLADLKLVSQLTKAAAESQQRPKRKHGI